MLRSFMHERRRVARAGRLVACLGWAALVAIAAAAGERAETPREGPSWDFSHGELKVSADGRFLVHADGTAFLYLGDTAWELFHRLNREEVEKYLENRRAKGFTVIQAVALAEYDGLKEPNPYGHRPLKENDPARPDVKDGPQNDYWDHVDFVVSAARAKGLYIGLLPTWGDKVTKAWGIGPVVFSAANAEAYGRFLGRRYRDAANVIWILGGDRAADGKEYVWLAMAKGLAEGDGGRHLKSYHPQGGLSSSKWFHRDAWLDFNMLQSGHMNDCSAYGKPENYEMVTSDWSLEPVKPVLDGEPIYEDTPDGIFARGNINGPRADAAAVRRKAYWAVFAGACGHTYGHNDVYGFYVPAHPGEAENFAWGKGSGRRGHWKDALDAPGAIQMQYVRALMESRPIPGRIPDPTLVIGDPLKGLNHIAATRASDGSYAMIYLPFGKPVHIRTDKISERAIRCWWFDPRTGNARPAGEHAAQAEVEFQPPSAEDWVLVLDDAAKNYPPPGRP